MIRTPIAALTALTFPALLLGACSKAPETGPSAGATSDTVAQALASENDLSTLSQAVVDAQLNEVLDGSGSYTILAPTDEAFAALGDDGKELLAVQQRPLLVGLLREHIVPGHLTPDAIGKAIDARNGAVTMTTMGGGSVNFARDGEAITVTRSGGTPVQLVGNAIESGNGMVVPIGAVLVPAAAASGDAATQ